MGCRATGRGRDPALPASGCQNLTMSESDLRTRVAELMPQAREELSEIVAIRSVADPRQFPPEECLRAATWVADRFAGVGFDDVRLEETADGSSAVDRVAAMRRPRRPHGAALRPLRRAAPAERGRLAHAAVPPHRGGRPLVRPRSSRLQGQPPHAPHRPARARRRPSGPPQTGRRGIRGAGHRRARGVRPRPRRSPPRRRHHRRRHRQRRRRTAFVGELVDLQDRIRRRPVAATAWCPRPPHAWPAGTANAD